MSGDYDNKINSAFFVLLQSGLWAREVSDFSFFPLSDNEWQSVLQISREQTVTGLIYDAVCSLPDEFLPPDEVMTKLVIEVDGIEKRYKLVKAAQESLLNFYNRHGLHPIVLKGLYSSSLYEKPSLRSLGDIDLYFNEEEFSKATELLKTKLVPFEKEADGGICYEYKSIVIEHHPRIIDMSTPSKQAYLKSLELDAQQLPSLEQNAVLMNLHILKHAFGKGVGLRQICDYARFLYTIFSSVDSEIESENNREVNEIFVDSEIERKENDSEKNSRGNGLAYLERISLIYKELGLTKWTKLLVCFMVEYLGLDESIYIVLCNATKSGCRSINRGIKQNSQQEVVKYKDRDIQQSSQHGVVKYSVGDKHPTSQQEKITVKTRELYNIVISSGNFGQKQSKSGKFHTAISFLKRIPFSLKYAPQEAFWTFVQLIKGQF